MAPQGFELFETSSNVHLRLVSFAVWKKEPRLRLLVLERKRDKSLWSYLVPAAPHPVRPFKIGEWEFRRISPEVQTAIRMVPE